MLSPFDALADESNNVNDAGTGSGTTFIATTTAIGGVTDIAAGDAIDTKAQSVFGFPTTQSSSSLSPARGAMTNYHWMPPDSESEVGAESVKEKIRTLAP
jgi:hypothetical protein